MKILVVDDEEPVRSLLDRALKRDGHEVSEASNIADAFEILASEVIDLLFLDLRMPGGDGMDLIRKINGSSGRPKIIICSAFIAAEREKEMRNSGICVLKKPFTLEELNAVLNVCSER